MGGAGFPPPPPKKTENNTPPKLGQPLWQIWESKLNKLRHCDFLTHMSKLHNFYTLKRFLVISSVFFGKPKMLSDTFPAINNMFHCSSLYSYNCHLSKSHYPNKRICLEPDPIGLFWTLYDGWSWVPPSPPKKTENNTPPKLGQHLWQIWESKLNKLRHCDFLTHMSKLHNFYTIKRFLVISSVFFREPKMLSDTFPAINNMFHCSSLYSYNMIINLISWPAGS